MELLFPQKNYTLGPNILKNRPPIKIRGVRNVKTLSKKDELERRTKFSYAVLDMLQIKPSTKLMLLQVLKKLSYNYDYYLLQYYLFLSFIIIIVLFHIIIDIIGAYH